MNDLFPEELKSWVQRNFGSAKWSGNEAMVICPYHDDHKPSLSVNVEKGVFHCFACDESGHINELADKIGVPHPVGPDCDLGSPLQSEKRYEYRDQSGELIYTIIRPENSDTFRLEPKGEKQRILYNTRKVYSAIEEGKTVWWVEGEKDVDTLAEYGIVATTTPFGSYSIAMSEEAINNLPPNGKFLLVGDFDKPGRTYIKKAGTLLSKDAKTLQFLPYDAFGLKSPMSNGFDISDWVADKKENPDLLTAYAIDFSEWSDSSEEEKAALQIRLDDRGIADWLISRNPDKVRWVESRKEFYVFDGSRWKVDDTRHIYRLLNLAVDDLEYEALNASSLQEKKRIKKATARYRAQSKIEHVVKSVKNVEGISVPDSDFDTGVDLINLPNGTYDLSAEKFQTANPKDLITKVTGASYDPEAQAPMFMDFLDQIFEKDEEIISFLQKFFGYCLSGRTTEQIFTVFFGTGKNGKSVLTNIISHVLGEYATPADRNVVSNTKTTAGAASPEVTQLIGTRFAVVSETNDRSVLNEAQVKNITGSEKITARPLYSNQITFDPQFKIVLVSNYKPGIKGTDNGIWRRVVLVPFNYTVPDDQVDRRLEEKLREEASGILNWMIDGYKRFKADGKLEIPEAIRAATEDYRKQEDYITHFIESECTEAVDTSVPATKIFEAYKEFMDDIGEEHKKYRAFKDELENRGYKHGRQSQARVFKGIRVGDFSKYPRKEKEHRP